METKVVKGKKVLIVEDDFYVVKFLNMALKPLQLSLIHTVNGKDSVDRVKNDPEIALVLMDIKLPLMNGYVATKEIKKIRPELPVIAQTAFALAGDEEKAINAGCDEYITKPLNRKKLITLIQKYLTK